MLHKLHDPKLALADKLSALDGINSWKTAKASGAHKATLNVYGTTDRIESNFGGVDNVMHTFRQIAPEHASDMQVENRQKHLAMPTDWVCQAPHVEAAEGCAAATHIHKLVKRPLPTSYYYGFNLITRV